jgi:hypothetical protein
LLRKYKQELGNGTASTLEALNSKGNNYHSEEMACRVGENFCQLFIKQGINIQNI